MERLATQGGKIYRDIEVISADKNGLLFRHSKGIAKESFSQLSSGIREMYQPVAEVPALHLTGGDAAAAPGEKGTVAPEKPGVPSEVVLTLLIRRPVSAPCLGGHPMNWHPHPGNWPSHWERFHPAHYLTNPICRAAATDHLLRVSGLLPPAMPQGSGATVVRAVWHLRR